MQTQEVEKNPVGRPSKIDSIDFKQAETLARLGMIDKEIALVLGIAESTLNLYKKNNLEFSESLRRGKIEADARVVESLYKKARGFEITEIHKETKTVPITTDGNTVDMITEKKEKKITRYFPPSDTSIVFWLKNRMSDRWKDSREIDLISPLMPDNKLQIIIIDTPRSPKETNKEFKNRNKVINATINAIKKDAKEKKLLVEKNKEGE